MKFYTVQIAGRYYRLTRFLGVMLIAALLATSFALSIPILNLRSTSNFVILAGAAITSIAPTTLVGDVGLSPAAGSYITGFDGTNVNGTLYVVDASGPAGSVQNATLLQTAKSDLTTAYNDAAGRTPVPTGTYLNPNGGNIGGLSLTAGLYKFTSDAAITGADVTLTGNATDVWIFQIATSLNVGSGIHVILSGGALASNIFWQVGTSATIGTYAVFKGTILSDQSISFGTGSTMQGRALAFTGAVTMASGMTSINPSLTAPIFSIDSLQVRFGNINDGFTKKDTITVTNTGTSDLTISTVTSSNALFTVSPTSGTITPGSTQKFFITYAPLTDGSKTGYIYFNHNASNKKDSISVSGTGISPVFSVSPPSINYGNLRDGLTRKDSVTVTNTGTANLVISTVTSSNALFTVTPTTGTITPGSTLKFYVTFAPLVDGLQNGYIYFNHNAANKKDSISVSGTGISPKFSAVPMILNFGNVRDGLTKKDSTTVTNIGTADLIISTVTSSNALFTVTPVTGTITPGSTLKFYITFAPLVDGLQNGYIYFNHNATNAKDSINVSGTGVSPKFSASPMNLNFGKVNDGFIKRDSINVTNIGTSDLIISSVSSSNTLFIVFPPTTGTLTPGLSQSFFVAFAPITDGFQSGYIYFNHNATNAKDSILVTGTGVSPKFTINPLTLNIGNVNLGLSKTGIATVTNTGTADLIISSMTSTNPLFTVAPMIGVISAGGSLQFNITFSPLIDGIQSSYIYFYDNTKNGKDSIRVTGSGVLPKFSVNPKSLAFGNVNNAITKMDSVTVTNIGTGDLIITSFTSTNTHFVITSINAAIRAGESEKFYITFTPLTSGFQDGYIIFNFNATNLKDSIYVSGTGIGNPVLPVFAVTPQSLNFGYVNTGTTKLDSVTVTNTGAANLIISSITSANVYYNINPRIAIIAPGTSQKIYISFAPLMPGYQSGYVYFYHNAANMKDSIYVSGTGVGYDVSPKFSASNKFIDFGNVFINTLKQKSVIITNTGTTNLIITGVKTTDIHYIVTPITFTIDPGASLEIFITFAPTVLGQVNAKIIFTHNAGLDTINVTGIGVAPNPVITIKAARALPIGTPFEIEGVVTRTLGSYTRIQDSTAAITILQPAGVFFNEVGSLEIQMGDMIRVQGKISELNNLKVINSIDLTGHQRLSRLNALPIPVKVKLSELGCYGEKYESCLITLNNLTISGYGDSTFQEAKIYQVTDASDYTNTVVIRIPNKADTYMDGMPFIGTSVTFEGVLSQSSDCDSCGYQLTPVLPSDLRNSTTDVSGTETKDKNSLEGNYPNPFNSSTTILYIMGNTDYVSLKVFDILGNEIATLVNGLQNAGTHTVTFSSDINNSSPGSTVYIYRLKVGSFVTAKQMILVK